MGPELPPEDTLLRRYHVNNAQPNGLDFPTSANFRDKDKAVSVDLLSIWKTEEALRQHVDTMPKSYKKPEGLRKQQKEFGFTALSSKRVSEELGLTVNPDPKPKEDPSNEAHHIILTDDPDHASVALYGIAMGYSPPPDLQGVPDLLRCARWQALREVMPSP